MATVTVTLPLEDSTSAASVPGPYLVVALDAARPQDGGNRYSLHGLRAVEIGRGPRRRAFRQGNALRIELPDTALSTAHARLIAGDGWTLEDAGSKNGTFVAGERVTSRPLGDGDVFDAARTVFVFRDPGGAADPGDLALGVGGDALDTLDPQLAASFATLDRVARADVPVLILGETGTGKELLARAVHARSGRGGHYVAVNCGALPPTLVESELFGSKRGAFSGAVDERLGLVRAADHGTLFLDEIAELAPTSQAALLRVLQEREVVPVGGHAPIKVDLRVVAATCQDLSVQVAFNRFRRDLYARLSGHAVVLPPLRQRTVDLGVLTARVLARHPGGGGRGLDRAAARALFTYDWPNNVRELDQALGAALAMVDGDLGVAQLPAALRAPPTATTSAHGATERARLEALLREHQGNVSKVADALGTSRSQVRRLAERFGLAPERHRAG